MMELVEMIGNTLFIFIVAGIYSMPLWKDSAFSKSVQSLFLSAVLAHSVVTACKYIADNTIGPLMQGKIVYLVPLILGPLLFASISQKDRWMSRVSFAVLVGVSTGYAMRGMANLDVIKNVSATFLPLFTAGDAITNLSNIIVVVGTVTVVSYFFMTYKHEGPLGWSTKLGRLMMMVTFGAAFGNTIMGRIAYLTGALGPILQSLGLMN